MRWKDNVLKRVLSFALVLLMVIGMMPQITIGASVATITGGTTL